jgi:DNA replication protein DnaC
MSRPTIKRRSKEEIFGKEYANATLSNLFWSHDIIERVHEWTKDPNRFLVLLGSSGTGKTHLCAALWDWAIKFSTSRHWDEDAYLSKIKKSFDLSGDAFDELKQLIDDEYISFDDVGSDSFTEWNFKQIHKFIDIRRRMQMPTVITSNLSIQEISKKISPRTASRLMSKGNIIIDLFEAPDFRVNPPTEQLVLN